jgi:hypothetical protein
MPEPQDPDMEAEDTGELEGGPDSYFGGGEQANPEEQAMYEKAMDAIWGLIYSKEETAEDMVAAMENAGGQPDQIGMVAGELALPLMELLDQDMESKGKVLTESVRLEVAQGLIEEVLELAEVANLLPEDEDGVGVAVAAAIDTMISRYGRNLAERGMISPQAGQQMLHEMRGVAADHMGIPPEALVPQGGGPQQPQGGGPQQPQGSGLMDRGGPPA